VAVCWVNVGHRPPPCWRTSSRPSKNPCHPGIKLCPPCAAPAPRPASSARIHMSSHIPEGQPGRAGAVTLVADGDAPDVAFVLDLVRNGSQKARRAFADEVEAARADDGGASAGTTDDGPAGAMLGAAHLPHWGSPPPAGYQLEDLPAHKGAPATTAAPTPATTAPTAFKPPAGLSVPSKMPGFTFKMPGPPEDVGAVVQALIHRTPTTSPPWPVRCLCLRRTVGTSSQLNVRAWCPDENCDSAHLHRIATSRRCSRRRRGSCSPRWPTRDWRRYATHARAPAWPGKEQPAS
jgi:hypothetical protein